MCGIAGIVERNGSPDALREGVRRMIDTQKHRGPDGHAIELRPHVALGHLRLAIIDLTDAANQPMVDASGRYHLIFNGEIYNYIELRRELEESYPFRTQSDSEVLLAAYATWGAACLTRLRGMFAFAIWDERDQRLFAARDRFGIKPFHYWTDGKRFAFASELKALVDFLPRRSAQELLARQYLAWNLLDHDPEQTMIDGIKRLPAAHSLDLVAGAAPTIRRYWDLHVSNELTTPAGRREELTREFGERFGEAVRLHLRADVPVGTALSGGIDSSAIAGFMNAELRRSGAAEKQHTFSACFEVANIDERPYMNAVVRKLGCHAHYVYPQGERLREELDRWLWHQEEPVGGSGAYSQYCVARLAHEAGVKVLLDGQGADEMFAGYRKFILIYLRQLASNGLKARALREAMSFGLSWELLRTSKLLHGRRYLFGKLGEIETVFNGNGVPSRPASMMLGSQLGDRLTSDLFQYSLPVLLRFEDRNTMAFGIESRVPFLDHELIEWAASLPADMRLSGGWTKRIVREGSAAVLPEMVRKRKSKLGFSTPESQWVAGPLKEWLASTIENAAHLGDHINMDGARRLAAEHRQGRSSGAVQTLLFRLAIYETWGRLFLR